MLLTYITSALIGDGSWCVTTEIFFVNYQEQIQIYETLVKSPDHLYGVQKCKILENVIDPFPSFQAVKIILPNSKYRQVPLSIMINILNYFSQLHQPTTKKSSKTLSLTLNNRRVSMRLDSCPMMGMKNDLT